MSTETGRGMSLHNQVFIALVLGAIGGAAANWYVQRPQFRPEMMLTLTASPVAGPITGGPWPGLFALEQPTFRQRFLDRSIEFVFKPAGDVFRRMLFLTVVPLVFASLALGVSQLGGQGNLGRIGVKTFGYFVVTMSAAVVIGLSLVNTIRPGDGLPEETRHRLLSQYGDEVAKRGSQAAAFGVHTFVQIIPTNPLDAMVRMDMLAVIFFALLVGVALTGLDESKAKAVTTLLDAINDVMVRIIGWAMALAPIGVFAMIFAVSAQFGTDLLKPLGMYVVIVLVGLAIQMFGVLSVLLLLFSRINPVAFFSRVRAVVITAFSTSSSSATLPTSIKTSVENLNVPPAIAGFVLPLGATMNMNGTALFEGVTVVFLAQVFGVPLSLADQIIVVVLAVLTAVGAAGVPGGSLPLLMMVLTTVGVPSSGIALILGVDRLLDMCRTTLNVVGDMAAATFVARSEGHALLEAT